MSEITRHDGPADETVTTTRAASSPARQSSESRPVDDPTGETDREGGPSEYAHLRTKRAEREGNVETAVVTDVFVGEDVVVLTLSFDWTPETTRVRYDLDADRDVLKLEALTDAAGFDFEQVGHLEDLRVDVVYTGRQWVPQAHASLVEGQGSAGETFRTELRLLVRELARSPRFLRRWLQTLRNLSTRQTIVAVIIAKKLLVVAMLAYLLL